MLSTFSFASFALTFCSLTESAACFAALLTDCPKPPANAPNPLAKLEKPFITLLFISSASVGVGSAFKACAIATAHFADSFL